MSEWLRAARMIVAWMTVLPVSPAGPVDRAAASRAITCLPVAGAVVGGLCAALSYLLTTAGAPPLLAAALVVGATALLTRGMHIDGLADVVDALSSYAEPERAREIMRSGPVGPLGAGALAVVAIVEVAAYAALVEARAWAVIAAVGVISRAVPVLLCRRALPASPGGGFGPLVAGTQGPVAVASSVVIAAVAGGAAGWLCGGLTGLLTGLVVVTVLVVAAIGFGAHVVRRLGGISGDVLGAATAGGAMVAAAGFAIVFG